MKRNWLLPSILVAIHLALIILLFAGVETSPDGEAVMAWRLFHFVDFPVSFVLGEIDHIFWRNDVLWYDDTSLIFLFSHRMGWDHLNVGAALMFFIGGTLQWLVVGTGIQIIWHKVKQKRYQNKPCISPRRWNTVAPPRKWHI